MRKAHFFLGFLLVLSLFFLSCTLATVENPRLEPSSQRFLDVIRYIITPEEEKIFREMPPEDRGEFIRDFWKRRDPTPDTDLNEFREQYYTRLAVADKAFQAGLPGWKTDRGRIYILLGPPTDIIRKAMGDTPTEFGPSKRELPQNLLEEGTVIERPTETWVYNQYPDYFSGPLRLVFVAYENTRDYKLITDVEVKPFSMLTYHQSDPNMNKYEWVGRILKDESTPAVHPFLDYRVSLGQTQKDDSGNRVVGCSVQIAWPDLTFSVEPNGYAYDLVLSFEVRHVADLSIWRESRYLKDLLTEEDLKLKVGKGETLEQEVVMPLLKGENQIYISLEDRVQQKRLRKLKIVRVK